MPSILLLGDSHTYGTYGKALEGLFKGAGWDVTRVGWVGASATSYLNGKYKTLGLGGQGDLDAALAKTYDVAIVSLGTNDAALSATAAQTTAAASKIRELAGRIKAKSIYWVGGPAVNAQTAKVYSPGFATVDLNTRIARLWSELGPSFGAKAIDPRAVTKPFTDALAPSDKLKTGDIHFGPKGGEAWAKLVFDTIVSGEAGLAIGVGEDVAKKAGFPVAIVVAVGLALSAWLYFRRKR